MTEIPEHLLKRSKERRAALGLPGGEGGDEGGGGGESGAGDDAPKAAAPAKAEPTPAPAKVEEAPPPPPKPKPPYIKAAENRKRIPYWAMPVIALLPVWAVMYTNSVKEPEVEDLAVTVGAEVYSSCSGCHGAGGEGGVGAQLSEGEVLLTYPDPVAMMEWIYLGAEEWTGTTGAAPYGDPDRPDGPHNTGTLPSVMPAFGDLDAEELASVTRYVRENLSGEPVASPEVQDLYEEWATEAIENAEAGELVYQDIPGTDEAVAERVDILSQEG
ncbi:MAG: c-type cytochrome [Iamia sp.]